VYYVLCTVHNTQQQLVYWNQCCNFGNAQAVAPWWWFM